MRIGSIFLAILITIYYYFLVIQNSLTPAWGGYGRDLLYPVELVIHEAGHMILYPFSSDHGWSMFVQIAGGTLLQWLMPAVFVLYFALKRQWFSTFFVLFWFGHSLLSSVPYIADAQEMNIPLLADGMIHDWNYMLSNLNLLKYDDLLARIIYYKAVIVLTLSVLGSWWFSIREKLPHLYV